MVAISIDDLSGASSIVQELGIPFPVLYDTSREVVRLYKVQNAGDGGRARPATFILDTEGVIQWKYVGSGIGDRPPVSTILRLGCVRRKSAVDSHLIAAYRHWALRVYAKNSAPDGLSRRRGCYCHSVRGRANADPSTNP